MSAGMVKRIRGVAYSMKVSPQNTNRMVDGCRRLLNSLLADVYIFTDAVSGKESGLSPGYGMTLVAETTSGCLISAEACAMQVCRPIRDCCSVTLYKATTEVHPGFRLGIQRLRWKKQRL